ncbi:hypothetical protein E2C01_024175 [Portunus trituberculatus]|uniref:Uncharacterized protein n=1 Tax=Portunus trituberculatus TaxID=210409 RepID=A0A5B7ED50_PORTR|nr:hypothetical protein [Portunus trituberculatus]
MRDKRGKTQLDGRWEAIVAKEDERTGQGKNGGRKEGRKGWRGMRVSRGGKNEEKGTVECFKFPVSDPGLVTLLFASIQLVITAAFTYTYRLFHLHSNVWMISLLT